MTMADDFSKREQSKAGRRTKIVEAVRAIIRETGETDLSMRTLAKRAGVSLATPYNLFGSKRAVVLAVLEDERDFALRFNRLKAANAFEQIFEAHELGITYFVEDPDFYRPLWKALLDTSGKDDTGLASPARQEYARAAWHRLLRAAQDEGLLRADIPVELLERTLSHQFAGVMLSWAMETLETRDLRAASALGYAFVLSGAASVRGQRLLARKVDHYQKILLEDGAH